MKLAFIAAGNMASAIISAVIAKGVAIPRDITVCDIDPLKAAAAGRFGVEVCKTAEEAIVPADFVVLGLRPFDIVPELKRLTAAGADFTGKTIISLAAGVSTELMQSVLDKPTAIVRTMPNTPMMVGCGMCAMCRNEHVADGQFHAVNIIFKAMGEVLVLPEEQMNDVIAVNGSSPAYVYLFAQAMLEGAKELGFGEKEIYRAVLQSLKGGLEMLMLSGRMPAELIAQVAHGGGTTQRAMESFEKDGFKDTVVHAMRACTERANEISAELTGNNGK